MSLCNEHQAGAYYVSKNLKPSFTIKIVPKLYLRNVVIDNLQIYNQVNGIISESQVRIFRPLILECKVAVIHIFFNQAEVPINRHF